MKYDSKSLNLASYSSPFFCEPRTLPEHTRVIRPKDENYVLLGHGFKDVVTDYIWNARANNSWEHELTQQMELYLEAIKALEPTRKIYVDLGANIGTHMLHLASRGYETHGFEPDSANYALAHCALAFSKISTPVRFNHFGLCGKVQSVCMESVSGNMGDTRVDPMGQCEPSKRANMDTLKNYYQRFLRRKKVAVLKIDIQGFEIAALQQGTALFDSNDAPEVVMLEYEPQRILAQGYDPPELIHYFQQRNYSLWHLGNTPFGLPQPDFINGTSVPWRDSDLYYLKKTNSGFGYFDIVAIKESWKAKAEKAGYRFVGGTLVE